MVLSPTQAQKRGGDTELRFFSALQAPAWDKPRWFYGLRHATHQEDQVGIDAVLQIDAGDVPTQIKTSVTGLKQHVESYGNQHLIIVIGPLLTIGRIREKTMDFLFRYRRRMLRTQRARR